MNSCKEYALRLLSFKDRTENEIRKKLSEKGFGEEEVEEVIVFLKEYGYVNDLRYAEKFISDAVKIKKWGHNRIVSELLMRGVDKETILLKMEDSEEDEGEIITDEIKKRFKNADFSDRRVKMRVYSYFARRGFSSSDIYKAMNSVCAFEDIETDYGF